MSEVFLKGPPLGLLKRRPQMDLASMELPWATSDGWLGQCLFLGTRKMGENGGVKKGHSAPSGQHQIRHVPSPTSEPETSSQHLGIR
jgi:hypothetical protein